MPAAPAMNVRRLPHTLLAILCMAVALFLDTPTHAAEPQSAAEPRGQAIRPGKPAASGAANARGDIRRYLAASRAATLARADYQAGTGSLENVLTTQKELTTAEIHYTLASAYDQGNPALHEYLMRRAEVSALYRAAAEMKKFAREVPKDDRETVQAEHTRYQEELKLAESEFDKASKAWRSAERSGQLQHLDRSPGIRR